MNKRTRLPVVSICFAEEEINHLFSELLRSRGVPTRILQHVSEANGETKVITEPQYFPQIPDSYKQSCLIVGNKESLKGLTGVLLSRPLTEFKIETAIESFLDS